MAENCNHDCSSCGESCSARTSPQDFQKKPNALSHIKKVIAVVSGKGGVGKSSVTALLASHLARSGKSVAILDADITGPSIPKAFGIHGRVGGDESGITPAQSALGIKIISLNLLTANETDPVVWRGPIIAGVVEQFWTDVVYGDIDCMFVDMPPGTGDVPLTVFQSLPVDGVVIVTTPQELVGMIVEKSINMANLMKIPVVALVENLSYMKCPHCGERLEVFGASRVEEAARAHGIKLAAKMPIDPELAAAIDDGEVEGYVAGYLDALAEALDRLPSKNA